MPRTTTREERAAYDTPPPGVYVYWCRGCRGLLHVSFSRYEHGGHVICSKCKSNNAVVDSYKHYKKEGE